MRWAASHKLSIATSRTESPFVTREMYSRDEGIHRGVCTNPVAALRPSEQLDSEAHEPERHKHANRREVDAARIDPDLLVGNCVDDNGHFPIFCAVLGIVRTTSGATANTSEELEALASEGLLSPAVLSGLDPAAAYGVWCYNRRRHTREKSRDKRRPDGAYADVNKRAEKDHAE
jgi:hypothetical protein